GKPSGFLLDQTQRLLHLLRIAIQRLGDAVEPVRRPAVTLQDVDTLLLQPRLHRLGFLLRADARDLLLVTFRRRLQLDVNGRERLHVLVRDVLGPERRFGGRRDRRLRPRLYGRIRRRLRRGGACRDSGGDQCDEAEQGHVILRKRRERSVAALRHPYASVATQDARSASNQRAVRV